MRYPELPESLLHLEEGILETWREEDLFRKTLELTARGEPFVFYEGPPTANGKPGLHHIISRTLKDLVCRHRAMTGRSVTRIAGWDTHGLPVEIEAERKLGISGKPEIEGLGIERFNEVCRDSVFTYKEDWEALSERIGYWLDYSNPYVTYHTEYIESVWWVLKELAERGLLYRGYKSVPYCPRCGTALSSHEVAQGYRDIEDASLFFLCPLKESDGKRDANGRAFLAWTTTPWTVPSNVGLAIHPNLRYAEVHVGDRRLILAEALVETVLGEEAEIVRLYSADELAGQGYERPLDLVPAPEDPGNSWSIVLEDFVSAEEGTGIVHMAPAFGSDDYAAGQRHGLSMLRPVDDAGRFLEEIPVVGGLFVKDADPLLVEELEKRGNLYSSSTTVHNYPHCWRCDSPLIYMARDSWFAATSTLKNEMLAENRAIGWLPPEVGEKRFGEWLENNVDWALSRDRYWGTPLPAWVCEDHPEHVIWVGGLEELRERAGGLPDEFDPHRPFIDQITFPCASCGGTMTRTPGVVDVWFDSGAMPFAQWHYPFENQDEFEKHFPADFICEAIDQTRGWFYSLLAISVMLGRGSPFRNAIVNGHILDEEGLKMSKSRGNVVDPWDAVGEHGADAVRWYLVTVSQPGASKRYDPEGVRESSRKFFDTLFNTYHFFSLYASAEQWAPSDDDPEAGARPTIDRWILSRFSTLVDHVAAELDVFHLTRAYRAVGEFLNEELSNWYVRRSRSRFWGSGDSPDSRAAFRTLWEILVGLARLVAPVTPFVADWIHRALAGGSVHLAPFPTAEPQRVDRELEEGMAAVRGLTSLGRAAREEAQIRVRQPLGKMYAVTPGGVRLDDELLDLLKDELNVKEVSFLGSAEGLVGLVAKPNFRALGPRFQKRSEEAAAAIRALTTDDLRNFRNGATVQIRVGNEDFVLQPEELDVLEEAREGLVVQGDGTFTAALDPTLDDALRREGLARELVNRIQRLRKESGLHITDRIFLGISGGDAVIAAADAFRSFISGETLAPEYWVGSSDHRPGFEFEVEVDLDGQAARLGLSRLTE
ncbi:MAG: isoleucine--tRNA ligase [Gemmatimonadota bacterium]|jgi:isoleucyl-tRNA synthetase